MEYPLGENACGLDLYRAGSEGFLYYSWHNEHVRLLVRNLPRSTTEQELRELFESQGRVQSATIVMDAETGGSKGFGFVEMPKAGEAKAAVHQLNALDLDGNKIRVKKAQPKPSGNST